MLFVTICYTIVSTLGADMPIYEYYCKRCNRLQEINVLMKDRDSVDCCWCGQLLERQIVFRGVVYSETANGGMK
jgi:putative FmdB family regulatory protein